MKRIAKKTVYKYYTLLYKYYKLPDSVDNKSLALSNNNILIYNIYWYILLVIYKRCNEFSQL